MNSSPNNRPNCKKDHIRTRIPTDPNSNAKTSWYKNMAPTYNSNTTDLSMSGLPTHNYPRYKHSNRYYPKINIGIEWVAYRNDKLWIVETANAQSVFIIRVRAVKTIQIISVVTISSTTLYST